MKLEMAFKNYCSQVPSVLGAGFSDCHGTNNVHAGRFQRMKEDGWLMDPTFPKLGYPREVGTKVDEKEIQGMSDGYRCRHCIRNCNTYEILSSSVSMKTPMLE